VKEEEDVEEEEEDVEGEEGLFKAIAVKEEDTGDSPLSLHATCGWAPHNMARPGPWVIKRDLVLGHLFTGWTAAAQRSSGRGEVSH